MTDLLWMVTVTVLFSAMAISARLGAVSYLGTVVTFVAGIVPLGERPAWTQLAGCTLVVSVGVAHAVSAARRAA